MATLLPGLLEERPPSPERPPWLESPFQKPHS